MVGQLVQAGRRDERRKPLNRYSLPEGQRLKDEVCGVGRGLPQADRNAPAGRFEGDLSRKNRCRRRGTSRFAPPEFAPDPYH